MAIADIATAHGLLDTARNIEPIIDGFERTSMALQGGETSIDAVIAKLNSYIEANKMLDNKILELFGVNDEKALQAKFRKFNSDTGLVNLSGSNIQNVFIREFQIQLDEAKRETQQYLDTYFKERVINYFNTHTQEILDILDPEEQIHQLFLKTLYDTMTIDLTSGKISGRMKTYKGKGVLKANIVDNKDINAFGQKALKNIRFDIDKMTRTQRHDISDLMTAAKNKTKNAWTYDSKKIPNGFEMSFGFKWWELTQHELKSLSPEKAEKLFPKDSPKLKQINQQIKSLILAQVKDTKIVGPYIDKMLDKNAWMFFPGGNANNITGILGEITAMVQLGELLSDKYKSAISDWVGYHKINNREVSYDIILRDFIEQLNIGVQVKNSAQDLDTIPLLDINFAGKNLMSSTETGILQVLSKAYGLDFTKLEAAFDSEGFNIPAAPLGREWEEISIGSGFWHHQGAYWASLWNIFVDGYNLMQEVIFRIDVFLMNFAPDFLYMASGDKQIDSQLANLDHALDKNMSKITGNNLYIVNGVPHLATSMLETIKKDLDMLQKLKREAQDIETTLNFKSAAHSIKDEGKKYAYNYISYRNGHMSKADKYGNKTPHLTDLKAKTQLQSAFGFEPK